MSFVYFHQKSKPQPNENIENKKNTKSENLFIQTII